MTKQFEMICLEDLVPSNHVYRKFKELWDLKEIQLDIERIEKDSDYKGFGAFRLFLCLLIQFLEDLSDRELETYIQGNNHAKWFCGFSLTELTPSYTVFSRIRLRIGTNNLSRIFTILRDQLKVKGYMSEVFTFVDATHLISKANLWSERDEAIKQKYEKLNNETLPKVGRLR